MALDPTSWRSEGLSLGHADRPVGVSMVASCARVSTDTTTRSVLPRRRFLYGPDEGGFDPGEFQLSINAKAGDIRFLQLALNLDSEHFVNFDLVEGVVRRQGKLVVTARAEYLGHGWYRLRAAFAVQTSREAPALRRLLAVDDGDVGWHPATSAVGHFFIGGPTTVQVTTP